VYEARITIETATARLAAARASEHDLEQIAACLEAMRSERGDLQRWTAADLGFHLAVASASHNPFLSTLLAPLVKVIERGIMESFGSPEAVEAGLLAHESILERIQGRDAPGAEEAMRRHLIDSERRFAWARSGKHEEAPE
jgi:DNA-binding FadR family transcriptional regulator